MTPVRAARRTMLPTIAAAMLCMSTAGLQAFAADEPEKVIDKVVEDMAAEQAEAGEAADADMGEASYNIENCEEGDDNESTDADEDAGDSMEAEAGDSMDKDDGVKPDDLDADCEPMKK